jgi:hypothetical protein
VIPLAMQQRHAAEVLLAGKTAYDKLLNLCVWTKDNGGMGSFYRSQHELVFVFRMGKEAHRNSDRRCKRLAAVGFCSKPYNFRPRLESFIGDLNCTRTLLPQFHVVLCEN